VSRTRERDLDPSASPAAFFGSEVRHERLLRKMSQPDLGVIVGYDGSTVSRVEGGMWPVDAKFAKGCDKAFPERGGWFARFYDAAAGWAGLEFPEWTEVEQRATVIRWYEPLLVPGLLQTSDYAAAILGWKPDSADAAVNLTGRLERQRILTRDDPPELRVLLAESVLYHEVGGPEVMAAQVKHLAETAEHPRVTLQVLPDGSRAYGGWAGGFAVATEDTIDSAVYIESSVRGVTVKDHKLIMRGVRVFDALRSDALPWAQTREVLEKAVERWKL
jgi:transcriptional regulator with XRE-family HTH domain